MPSPRRSRDRAERRMTAPRGPQPFPGQEKRLRLLAFVRQDSIVRVDKRVEDTAMVWPHLLVIEFIAAMLWSIGLFAISAAFNATLLTFSLILVDAFLKAHGYIEFASDHFPGGKQLLPNYLIPIAVMLGLSFLLVVIVKRLYGANTREWNIAVFTGFISVYLVLTIVGTSFRGPGMDLFAPWAVPATHQCFEPRT